MFDFGDWRNMPDPNEGWQDKHKSGIARLGTMFDAMNYVPGIKETTRPIHQMAEQGADAGNRILSPIVGAAQKFTEATTPGMKQVQNAVPMVKRIDDFIRNKPVDALAIAAATFFSGGAASGLAGGGAGGAGAGAAGVGAGTGGTLGAAGAGAATSALTPAFSGGAALGTSAAQAAAGSAAGMGASAITPALATAGTAAPGMLGAAGTAALESAIPATYSGLAASTPAASQGILNTFATRLKPLKTAKGYYDNFKGFTQNEPNDRDRMNAMADQLAQNILNSNGRRF